MYCYLTVDHSNNNWRDGLARIRLCVSEIREWVNQNMWKLNHDKTELIVFTSKYKQDLYNDLSITICDTIVDCSSQVKDLGVIFDRVLSLTSVIPTIMAYTWWNRQATTDVCKSRSLLS